MSREDTGTLLSSGETEKTSDTENVRADLVRTLAVLYPDIEAEYLHQTCLRFNNRPAEIQTFLEENLPGLPARSARPPERLKMAEAERLWQCPGCRSWQIIQLQPGQTVISCSEVSSCGQFCWECHSPSHAPFNCRNSQKLTASTVQHTEEAGVFKRLSGENAMIIYLRALEILI